MIPYGRQDVTPQDIDAVVEVLRSDYLTQGSKVHEFEEAISNYCGAKFAVAVNSATSALHLACLALGLGPSDILWTSPITFVASANCAKFCGASVDFVDIDPQTSNMSIPALAEKLEKAKKAGRLPKIVIPVHFAGRSADMRSICELGKKYNFHVIEDASHAIGGRFQNGYVGSCEYSDVTIFSFHPVKIITTGEGGMATTNSNALATKMRLLRSHGITRDPALMATPRVDDWYYEQSELGYNYRLTDFQAALGLSQMTRLDKYVEQRNLIANYYNESIDITAVVKPNISGEILSSWHLYVLRIKDPLRPELRDQLFRHLKGLGIGVNLHYIPVHLQPYYKKLGGDVGYADDSFPNALNFYREAITLPIFPNLQFHEIDFITNSLAKFVAKT